MTQVATSSSVWWRRVQSWSWVIAGLGVSLWCISFAQRNVARDYAELGKGADVYAMPQGEHLVVFSLGYRAALADLLFGKTMVAAGIHFSEHRVFEHLDAYLKGILTLEPRYRDVYQYADTLLNLSSVEMPAENLRIARDIIEQGLELFPGDSELWMNGGLFTAYMAINRLPEDEDPDEWRAAGSKMILHACDIFPPDKTLPSVCFNSASALQKAGETEAAISRLRRLLAIADDPQTRAKAMQQLERLAGEREARRQQKAVERLSKLHMTDLPSVSRGRYQVLLPKTDVERCAGLRSPWEAASKGCASSFAELSLD